MTTKDIYTPVEKIAAFNEELRKNFNAGLSLPLEWRKAQLNKLKNILSQNKERFLEALRQDLKQTIGLALNVHNQVLSEIQFALDNLDKWVLPKTHKIPLIVQPGSAYTIPEPYGVVLIISPWNYPISLCLKPLVGAIAAGNCCLIKPSEVSHHCSVLLNELINSNLDTNCIRCVLGGAEETSKLLKLKFDYIFFTGGTAIGKIVMEAASHHLTPLTLELGGKTPALVDDTADLMQTARRVLWGKTLNLGQTCISPDYMLVSKRSSLTMIENLKRVLSEFFPKGAQNSPDYSRIINERHFDRLVGYLNEIPKEKIVFGGTHDRSDKFIEPTIILNPPNDSKLMEEEIFGPLLPIVVYDSFAEAVQFIKERPKPLSLYLFSKDKKVQDHVIKHTSSGGVVLNDVIVHYICPDLPFGGVGDSGFGTYHYKRSFKTFSHCKSVLKRGTWIDPNIRYPPSTPRKLSLLVNPPKFDINTTALKYGTIALVVLGSLFLLHTNDLVVFKFL
eukprot:TRINITY_DN2284_c0_g2_i1.p1 TRINITY_DN2284_c0_g2~~TRINITY_DN2284_c0_g2_i1.p1  ORF type:complete len:518 (+),score=90.32 TRINITY_DN2284_c0_g2_i1:44-1555(+)